MFERFTDRSRRVVVLAQEEARGFGHTCIGTAHLLLGLIYEGEGVAAKALEAFGVSLQKTRKQVERVVGLEPQTTQRHIPFTPRSKRVLELALREALQLGHRHIGTEHLLLGLIRLGSDEATDFPEDSGAAVLGILGVDLSDLRLRVIRLLVSPT